MRADRRVTASLLAVATLAAAVLPRLAPDLGPFALLGPLASALLCLPGLLWLAALLVDDRSPASAWLLRCLARASIWLMAIVVLADPAPNLPDALVDALTPLLDETVTGIQALVAGVVSLIVVGFVLSLFLGGPGKEDATPTERRTVRTGSGIHPVVALLARVLIRLMARLLLAALTLLLLAGAWTLDGWHGVRAVRGRETPPTPITALLVTVHDRVRSVLSTGLGLLGHATAGWGRRSSHGVWEQPAAVYRDEAGIRSARPWPREHLATADDVELAELGAILDAFDVALMGGGQPARQPNPSQQQAPRHHPYELRVERAWSRPGYHALVIAAEPAAAGAAMARVTASQLAAALDPLTRWTADELTTMLRLSDRRVADDPLRDGATGLFIGVDRPARDEPETTDPAEEVHPFRRAVERALAEAGLDRRFRHDSTWEDEDGATVVEMRASFGTAAEFADLQKQWAALEPAVSIHARAQVRLTSRLDPYSFLATLPLPPGQGWPSGEATDWSRVVPQLPVSVAHPSRVVLGLDRRSIPVTLELAGETSHLLVGASTGMGKTSLVQGILASLLWNDLRIAERVPDWPPLQLSILEAVKREHVTKLGPVATETVGALDGDEAIAAVERYRAEMERRYRELDGRPFDGRRMSRRILLLEEFATLRLSLERDQDERLVRALTAIANTGRGVACGVIVSVQKATVGTVPPAAKASLTRIAGWYPQASDLGVVLDHPQRGLLPRVPGRMAIQTAEGIGVFQALRIDDRAIASVVDAWTARFRPDRPVTVAPSEEPDDPLPRPVTGRDLEDLRPLTVARILYRWQAASTTPIVVSVRGVIAHVRDDLGLVPGRVEGWTAALADLERLGVLEPIADHATAPRRLAIPDWPTARAVILAAATRA